MHSRPSPGTMAAMDESGELLRTAVFDGDARRVATLLGAGTSPNQPDARGTTPLYAAAVHGNHPLVRLLLRAGADPNAPSTGEGEGTPLCAAACWGYSEVVRELLAKGAAPDLIEEAQTGMSALIWAAGNGHCET